MTVLSGRLGTDLGENVDFHTRKNTPDGDTIVGFFC